MGIVFWCGSELHSEVEGVQSLSGLGELRICGDLRGLTSPEGLNGYSHQRIRWLCEGRINNSGGVEWWC